MQCLECGRTVAVPLSVKTVSCPRCGDAYFVNNGPPRRAYPALHMCPVDHAHNEGPDYPFSKWMLPHTRPIVPGVYHVRFSCTEPRVLIAHWDGGAFRTADGQRVCMRTFMTWRGILV